MSYDYIGEKFRKALRLAKQGRYVEAFREIMAVLSLVEPYDPAWNKIYEIAEGLAEQIAEPQERINAYTSLANLLISKGLKGEAQRLLEKAKELAKRLTYPVASIKARHIISIVEGVSGIASKGEEQRLIAELNDLLFRLERIAQMSSQAAEEIAAKIKTLLDNLSASGVNVNRQMERFRSILERIRPKLSVEGLTSIPSKLETPTILNIHLAVSNKGLLPARDIRVKLVASPGGASTQTIVHEVKPGASVELKLELYIDRPGKYKIKAILEYNDITRNTYTEEVALATLSAEPRAVSSIATIQLNNDDAGRLEEARTKLVMRLVDTAKDIAKLLMVVNTKNDQEGYTTIHEILNDVKKLKDALSDVLDYATRLWMVGCPARVRVYRRALQVVEARLRDLEEKLEKRKIFKKNIAGKIVGFDERVKNILQDLARIISILMPLEMGKKTSTVIAEMLEKPTDENTLVTLMAGLALGLPASELKTLYTAANMIMLGYRLHSETEYRSIIDGIRQSTTRMDFEVEEALQCR